MQTQGGICCKIYMKTLIVNGRILTPRGVLFNHILGFEGDKITGIWEKEQVPKAYWQAEKLDARGQYVSPGFVDIHVHGGGGYDCTGSSPENIVKMCRAHALHGTTSIAPTVTTAALPLMASSVCNIREAQKLCKDATILGAHLEGPFLSLEQCGAQNPEYILPPTQENWEKLLSIWPEGITMMGVAVERDGALALGDTLRSLGITPSIAHSNASFEQVEEALLHGFRDVTHLYSGCSVMYRKNSYRHAGVVEAGLYFDDLTAQVIADGKHLPASLLRLIYKCKGADRIALITDALETAGLEMEEGTLVTQSNGMDMILDDGVMKLPDKQSFAGSIATTDRLVRNMVQLAGVPVHEAVVMASRTPARIVHADDRKGTLAPGMDADILFFDEDIHLSRVIAMGQTIMEK